MNIIRLSCLALLTAAFAIGCKPNTSDVMVETIDTAYLRQLPNMADTVIPIVPDTSIRLLGVVRGEEIIIGNGQKQMQLWYDVQGQVLLMTEKNKGRIIDSVAFYPNGQRIFKLSFNQQGQADGFAKYFYSDGRVREDGRFISGIKTGVWRSFDENGRLLETHEFTQRGEKLK
jgi:hypothetical protein